MSEPAPTNVRPTPIPSDVDRTAAHTPAADTSASSDTSDPDRTSVRSSSEHVIDHRGAAVPGYEILGELGRGGMGVVYKARQTKLNREVALKMILSGEHAGEKDLIRFLAEAEAIAAIKHPNVVQVYEYGESNGRPYMALEFIDGGSLAGRLKAGRLTPREAAELVGKIARGVAAAHDLGIVHRDLKPANVLLDSTNEPKVTDFGLVKRATGEELTGTNAVMGTPSYMSPEQAKGETKFVGPQADVWALGVILYECLTGIRPFVGDDSWTIIKAVIEAEPLAPRKRLSDVPRDLELICLKCLLKEPGERYPTAKELADDLNRWAAGEPVSVRASGLVERTAKWARRKPTLAAAYALTAITVVLTGMVAGAIWLWQKAEVAKGSAETARDGEKDARGTAEKAFTAAETARKGEAEERGKADRLAEKLVVFEYGKTMQLIQHDWRENRVDEARSLLAGIREDLRGWEWRFLHRLCHSDLLTLEGETGGSRSMSPDGRRVVTVHPFGVIWVWDAKTGEKLLTFDPGEVVYDTPAPEFSADGERITSLFGGSAVVWDAKTGKEVLKIPLRIGGLYQTAKFSADGNFVVVSERQSSARIWNAKTGVQISVLTNDEIMDVRSARFTRDGTRVLISGNEGVGIWETRTGAKVASIRTGGAHKFAGAIAEFSPDGSRVVTAGGEQFKGSVVGRIWDARTAKEIKTLEWTFGTGTGVYEMTDTNFSPDGQHVAIGTRELVTIRGEQRNESSTRVWNAKTGERVAILMGEIRSDGFSPDGTRLVTVDQGAARVWDVKTGEEVLTLKGHTGSVAGFSRDGRRVVTGGGIWDTTPRKETLAARTEHVATPDFGQFGARMLLREDGGRPNGPEHPSFRSEVRKAHNQSIDFACLSPDGSRAVSIGKNLKGTDPAPRVWNTRAKTWTQLFTLAGRTSTVRCASFSEDGQRVITGEQSGAATIWDAKTGKELLTLTGHTDVVRTAVFSPRGDLIATSSDDGSTRIWDASTGVQRFSRKGMRFARFSREGSQFMTRESDCLRIWNTENGDEVSIVRGPGDGTRFSPDGTRYLTIGRNTVRLWDPRTGAEVLTLRHPENIEIKDAEFSRDGARILTHSLGRTWVWDSQPVNRKFVRYELAPAPRLK